MNILFEDEHIIVCEKPAGIPTQAGKITEKDMVSELNNYISRSARGEKPRADLNIYLIHRLDKPVRGILVFAKNKSAAAKINTQMQNNVFCKRYYALVEGKPEISTGVLEDYMYKDSKLSKSIVVKNEEIQHTNAESYDIKRAELEYKVVDCSCPDMIFGGIKPDRTSMGNDSTDKSLTLLDIKLLTGRFHQIRCQLANMGCPIVSDSLYGAMFSLKNRKAIGLVAYSLEFNHPVTGRHMSFILPIQPEQSSH